MASAPTVELQSMPEGGSVALLVTAPPDSVEVRIIRRPDQVPATHTDVGPGSVLVSAHPSALAHNGLYRELVDYGTALEPLMDGKVYYYGVFSRDVDGAWSAGAVGQVAPESRFEVRAPDPIEVVGQRLQGTLHRLLATGRYDLTEEVKLEGIRVYESFPYDEDVTPWPCFTVHLDRYTEAQQFVGQAGRADRPYSDRSEDERATLHDVVLAVIGWTHHDVVRKVLRRLLRDALALDRLFYARVGFIALSYEGPADAEEFGGTPIYHVHCNLNFKVLIQPAVRSTQKVVTAEARQLVLAASGLITSATATSVTDATQAWQANVWTRSVHVLRVVSGAGAGQQRHVVSNDPTTVSVSPSWTTTPTPGSSYQILRLVQPADGRVEYQTNPS